MDTVLKTLESIPAAYPPHGLRGLKNIKINDAKKEKNIGMIVFNLSFIELFIYYFISLLKEYIFSSAHFHRQERITEMTISIPIVA